MFADDNDEGVIVEFVFFEKVESLADLAVVVGDLSEIAGHGVASFGGITKYGGSLIFSGG